MARSAVLLLLVTDLCRVRSSDRPLRQLVSVRPSPDSKLSLCGGVKPVRHLQNLYLSIREVTYVQHSDTGAPARVDDT